MKNVLLLTTAAIFGIAFLAPQANAQQFSTSTKLDVKAKIDNTCVFSTTSALAFPAYAPIGKNKQEDLDASSTVAVRCTAGLGGVALQINAGTTADASCTGDISRSLRRGGNSTTDLLTYELYQDAERTLPWGCDETTQKSLETFSDSTVDVVHTLYGRVPAGQFAQPGSYSDTIQYKIIF